MPACRQAGEYACLPPGRGVWRQLLTVNGHQSTVNRQRKSRWALLKTRFRNSLSSLHENRERNFLGLQRTANGRYR